MQVWIWKTKVCDLDCHSMKLVKLWDIQDSFVYAYNTCCIGQEDLISKIGDECMCLKELVNKQHKIVGGSCVAC